MTLVAAYMTWFGMPEDELGWLVDGAWTRLVLLVFVAVSVLIVGQLALKRGGRRRDSGSKRRLDFDLEVARMSRLPISPIAQLRAGPCHVEGEIRSATERLGADGAGVVYVNRAGGRRDEAVSSTLVLVGDATGQVALERLDAARVIAAPEDGGAHERVCLRIGDRVEILGEVVLDAPDETESRGTHPGRVYGTLGASRAIQVRKLGDQDAKTPERGSQSQPQP